VRGERRIVDSLQVPDRMVVGRDDEHFPEIVASSSASAGNRSPGRRPMLGHRDQVALHQRPADSSG
jgi:hypothetical protein